MSLLYLVTLFRVSDIYVCVCVYGVGMIAMEFVSYLFSLVNDDDDGGGGGGDDDIGW